MRLHLKIIIFFFIYLFSTTLITCKEVQKKTNRMQFNSLNNNDFDESKSEAIIKKKNLNNKKTNKKERNIDSINIQANHIRIKRDKLILSKKVKIKFSPSKMKAIDRLKSIALGINKKNFNHTIFVEFWNSPLQYSGYKLSKSKLILYGFDSNSEIILIEKGKDSLEFINSEEVFLLVKTEKFKHIPIYIKN